jgi:hypothetical protein
MQRDIPCHSTVPASGRNGDTSARVEQRPIADGVQLLQVENEPAETVRASGRDVPFRKLSHHVALPYVAMEPASRLRKSLMSAMLAINAALRAYRLTRLAEGQRARYRSAPIQAQWEELALDGLSLTSLLAEKVYTRDDC